MVTAAVSSQTKDRRIKHSGVIRIEHVANLPRDYSGVTFDSEMVTLWLLGRSEQTIKTYQRDARRFLEFAAPKSLADLTVKDVGDWVQALTGSLNYRIRRLTNIKSLLTFAHRTGYCVANVGAVIRLPRAKRRMQERVSELSVVRGMTAEAAEGRDRTLIRLMYASGCRVSEAVGVNFCDLKLKEGVVTFFGKGQKTRTVPVNPMVIREMWALCRPGDGRESPIFRNFVNGKRLHVRSVQRMVAAARLAGTVVVVTPHVFRHTHAADALENGAPIQLLQHQLGHSNVSTTNVYVHIRGDQGTGDFITL
jgi:integrase/recombinase XerD